MKLPGQEEKVTRRSFLGYGIAAASAFIATVVGSSSAIFAASPLLAERKGSRVSVGPVGQFQVGVPKLADFPVMRKDGWVEEETSKAVWVVRQSENDFVVYSGRCTHLGCAFSWHADQKEFTCPCHDGRFSLDGRVLGGPPPRALDKLNNSVEGGKLMVDYKDFRLGVPEKVEA